MGHDKLLAEWFWTDRWMGSSGFLLPIHARGLYREMLTQSWRRGAKLPHDFDAIRRAIGVTLDEWNLCWPLVSRFWHLDCDSNLVNDTQLEVYSEAKTARDRSSERGKKAAQAMHKQRTSAAQAENKQIPPSPSPSPSLISGTVSETDSKSKKNAPSALVRPSNGNGKHGNARSKRPIFSGQRLTVFEWMLDDCCKTLGPLIDQFDIHEWFFSLDAQASKADMVIPQRDNGAWLQSQLVAEAKRRGLPIAVPEAPEKRPGRVAILAAAIATIRREEAQ